MTAVEFLTQVYQLAQANDLDEAGFLIFEHIDRLLCDGKFTEVDVILSLVDPELLPSTLRRSFLTITFAAQDHLPVRREFARKVVAMAIREKGINLTRRVFGPLVDRVEES